MMDLVLELTLENLHKRSTKNCRLLEGSALH